eukprot:2616789-Amphidinium_carterae.1
MSDSLGLSDISRLIHLVSGFVLLRPCPTASGQAWTKGDIETVGRIFREDCWRTRHALVKAHVWNMFCHARTCYLPQRVSSSQPTACTFGKSSSMCLPALVDHGPVWQFEQRVTLRVHPGYLALICLQTHWSTILADIERAFYGS